MTGVLLALAGVMLAGVGRQDLESGFLGAQDLQAQDSGSQDSGSLDEVRPRSRQHVTYTVEQQIVVAGKPAVLELRFRVEDGYHVNSHAPKSELLMPTVVELGAPARVKLGVAAYPQGKLYSFRFDPQEKLDVYTGEFMVKVPVMAGAGAHELKGTLKYQACSQAACYPGKTLPLLVMFTAR